MSALTSAPPPLYGDRRRWALIQVDTLAFLPHLPDASVDAVVTDPPYGIDFGARSWDGRDIRLRERSGSESPLSEGAAFADWAADWAAEVCRVLRPGGHLLAFGAPRTVHRLTVGLEDAGLEIRDLLTWLHGQGVPKSRRLPGDRGTALKPAYEPIVMARRPLDGSVGANLARQGTGTLQIGSTRLSGGRWPANVVLAHDAGCSAEGCDADCPRALLDQQAPSVEPSRFFYCAKAPTWQREAGCDGLAARAAAIFSSGPGASPQRRNIHPTVKPLDLMRWLVRLAVPPGGTVLDPFAGSGTTGAAAVLEGRRFVGLEREADYLPIARARIAHWAEVAERRRS